MGKSTINGPFSIAMLVYQRVTTIFWSPQNMNKLTVNEWRHRTQTQISQDTRLILKEYGQIWFLVGGSIYLLLFIVFQPDLDWLR